VCNAIAAAKQLALEIPPFSNHPKARVHHHHHHLCNNFCNNYNNSPPRRRRRRRRRRRKRRREGQGVVEELVVGEGEELGEETIP
jgi:hypothetical protein